MADFPLSAEQVAHSARLDQAAANRREAARRQATYCHNCGGDGYSVEGGPCPACDGSGKSTPLPRKEA